MQLSGTKFFWLLIVLSASTPPVAPEIEPGPQVVADARSLLTANEVAAIGVGLSFRLNTEHARTVAIDQRDPYRDQPLDAHMKVDQLGFVRGINSYSKPGSANIVIEKIECDFGESREGNGDVTPVFWVKWIVTGPGFLQPTQLEAFSFGRTYSDWTWSAKKRQALWLRGAAAAYQAATFKLALELQSRATVQ